MQTAVVAWYDANKDRLVFDAGKRKFCAGGAGEMRAWFRLLNPHKL